MTTDTTIDKKIELKSFTAKSFMGISADSPIVIDFTKRRKKKNITIFEGNQGVGKSSTMNALMYALGAELEFKKENIVNMNDDTVSVEMEFDVKGKSYRVKITKSKFTLEMWNGDVNLWLGVGEPKATLKKLLGPVATSPLELKSMDGRKQIKWLREFFVKDHDGPGRKPKEETLMDSIEQRVKLRRDTNRDADRIRKSLDNNPLWQNAEENYKKFAKPVTVEEARTKLQQATEEKAKLEAGKSKLINLNQQKLNHVQRIQELEEALKRENELYALTLENIEKEEAWLKENEKPIVEQYNTAQSEYENINTSAVQYNDWKRVLEDKKVLDDLEEMSAKLTGQIDEDRVSLLELTKKYLPKMKGLEMKVATGIDDDQEGIFFQGKSPAKLSESELWEVFLAICDHNDVNFVFIENVSSLGSDAVSIINQLAEHDVKVFASEQNRKMNKMEITITDKID